MVRAALSSGTLGRSPIREGLGAVSVGVVDGRCLLDLDYAEDSGAEVDLNLVLTESGEFLEIQGTSESRPFTGEQLERLISLGRQGIAEIIRGSLEALSSPGS